MKHARECATQVFADSINQPGMLMWPTKKVLDKFELFLRGQRQQVRVLRSGAVVFIASVDC